MNSPYRAPQARLPSLDLNHRHLRNLRYLIGLNIFVYGSGFALLLLTFFAYVLGLGVSDGKTDTSSLLIVTMPWWLLSGIGLGGCWGLWRLKQWGVACYIFVWLGFQIHATIIGMFTSFSFQFTWSDMLATAIFFLILFGLPFYSVWHFWKRRAFFTTGLPFESRHL